MDTELIVGVIIIITLSLHICVQLVARYVLLVLLEQQFVPPPDRISCTISLVRSRPQMIQPQVLDSWRQKMTGSCGQYRP